MAEHFLNLEDWGPDYYDLDHKFRFELGELCWFNSEIQNSGHCPDLKPGFVVVIDRWAKGSRKWKEYRNIGYQVYFQDLMKHIDIPEGEMDKV